MNKLIGWTIVLVLLGYLAYLATLAAPMLLLVWIVLLALAGRLFLVILLGYGVAAILRCGARIWHEEQRRTP